jgi:hypothetical protein
MPRAKKPARRPRTAPAEILDETPVGEIRLEELTALRILRAAAVAELARARLAGLRAEAVRLLEQIDTEGRFRSLDRQIGELLPRVSEAEAEVGRLSHEVGSRYGIDPSAYTLDDSTFVLRPRPPVPTEES